MKNRKRYLVLFLSTMLALTSVPGVHAEDLVETMTEMDSINSVVDSSASLTDGVYVPDKFSWSGGSGRVTISCDQVTVSGGQAYATIVFSSDSYAYVKVDGNKYTGTVSEGTTSFKIPVELNANNQIIGLTTKMSASHEITYSIYVYLKAADQETSSGDDEAPEIAGLTYQSEQKMDFAENLKIYEYSDGIKLIQVDLNEKSEIEWPENEKEEVLTAEEQRAALYLADVVRYLIVPEDQEIPVGLDKEMIIIRTPVKSVYVASLEALEILDKLEMTDCISMVGFTSEECHVDSVREKMEAGEIKEAGTWEDPDFRQMLLNQCDLAIMPGEILLSQEETLEEDMERYEKITSGFATLDIPVLIDRSALDQDEVSKDEEAQAKAAEWLKAYGEIFECSEKANELYEDWLEEAGLEANSEEA